MRQLAGILLQMYAADADGLLALRRPDHQPAVHSQRLLVLRDLIALGQIGIEIILTREDAGVLHLAFQRQSDTDGKFDGSLIHDRQRARHARTDGTNRTVGRRGSAVHNLAAAEHLRLRLEFSVDFESDNRFVFHG